MPESLSNREILEQVLNPGIVKEIWTKNYNEAIPFTIQDLSVGAILPAMFYLFRRGHRRGKGKFVVTYADGAKSATITQVANILAKRDDISGFEGPAGQNVLADLLLSYCLENRYHTLGRDKPIIRAYPTHHLSSWIDLPFDSSNLRFVPEMIVGLLIDQDEGDIIVPTLSGKRSTRFPVQSDYADNQLLNIFSQGMRSRPWADDLKEQFDEQVKVGVDQLLTIRIAQQLGQAPNYVANSKNVKTDVGSREITNQHPIAHIAAGHFSDDLRIFLGTYGPRLPRQVLLPMIESCIGLGLSAMFLSSVEMLYIWDTTGTLPRKHEQQMAALFVDCSAGASGELRRASEESTRECLRRLHELPAILMKLRLLSYYSRNRRYPGVPPARPNATARINWYGELTQGRLPKSADIEAHFRELCVQLGELLHDNDVHPDIVEMLNSADHDPIARFSHAAAMMMGDGLHYAHYVRAMASCWITDQPNGMALSRRVPIAQGIGSQRTTILRSIVLNNTLLDFLVHRHLCQKTGKRRSLSYSQFLDILREDYGLFVDQAPSGQSISESLLQRNRQILEARLRELGLLRGVNDAESMKFLQSRFDAENIFE